MLTWCSSGKIFPKSEVQVYEWFAIKDSPKVFVVPIHTLWFGISVIIGVAFMVIVATEDGASEQTPFLTSTLYWVVVVNGPEVYVLVVFAIDVQLVPPSVDCSQRRIVPLNPETVNKPLVSPLQIELDVERVPPTLAAFTSILAGIENSTGAVPLWTTALKYNVVVKFVTV